MINENYLEYTNDEVLFHYLYGENTDWIYNRFQYLDGQTGKDEQPHVILNNGLFEFKQSDLKEIGEFEAIFKVGYFDGNYYKFNEETIRTKFPLKIRKGFELYLDDFQLMKGTPVIRVLDNILKSEIIIGDGEGEISLDTLKEAKQKYPDKKEINTYIRSRVARVISDELDIKTDYDKKLMEYVSKKTRGPKESESSRSLLNELEIERLTYTRDKLKEMLRNRHSYNELIWQLEILRLFRVIYPQYVRIIKNVKLTVVNGHQKIADFLIVNSLGYVDVIEVKIPDKKVILKSQRYRNNAIPSKELSNSVIQIENYLYSLSSWGKKGEETLTALYKDKLPDGMQLRISNPRGLLIIGMLEDLDEDELFGFELTRRHYSHIIDIMTYDDMIKRIDTLIEALGTDGDIIIDKK